MKHSAVFSAVENLRRALPWKGLSLVAAIGVGWFLRERHRRDGFDVEYLIRAYKGSYVDPTNVYKYYGSYGRS